MRAGACEGTRPASNRSRARTFSWRLLEAKPLKRAACEQSCIHTAGGVVQAISAVTGR
jgi:hypothetical protein